MSRFVLDTDIATLYQLGHETVCLSVLFDRSRRRRPHSVQFIQSILLK